MAAYLVSQLIGLVTKVLIAGTFNARVDLDAFVQSNRPSEALVTIMAGGILASSFIPIFVKFLVGKDQRSAWRLASGTANTILVILTVLAGLTALFAGPLVKYVLGVGFSADKQILTVALLRIQTISVIFFGLSGLVIGILNSHQRFLMSALAPAMYQIGQILGLIFLVPSMGIYGLAWGVVLGSVLNLLIQIPSLLRLKGQYFPIFGLRDASVGEVFRLMAPRMFGAAAVQLMVIVTTSLASRMVEGTAYALSAGFTLMIMAQAAIAQSVATAVMPTFSAQFARNDFDAIRRTLASAIRGVILLSVPATAGLVLLGLSIVAFLYPKQDARMISWALTWYAAGLVFHSVLEVLVRAYYAMHDTKTPVIVGATAMLICIGLEPGLRTSVWQPGLGAARRAGVGRLGCHRAGSDDPAPAHAQTVEGPARGGNRQEFRRSPTWQRRNDRGTDRVDAGAENPIRGRGDFGRRGAGWIGLRLAPDRPARAGDAQPVPLAQTAPGAVSSKVASFGNPQ